MRNRHQKYNFFINYFKPNQNSKILDIGVDDNEYTPYDNFLEKHYLFPENITALGITTLDKFRRRYPKINAVVYDGEIFPFKDKEFDIVWSNAVLEHVGSNGQQTVFLREINRCGKRAFVTTPNLHFPIEIHTRIPFLHWLPKRFFDNFLKATGQAWAAGNYMNLLDYNKLKYIVHEAGVTKYNIIRNKIGLFTLEFILII